LQRRTGEEAKDFRYAYAGPSSTSIDY